jgi:hypothetical protein
MITPSEWEELRGEILVANLPPRIVALLEEMPPQGAVWPLPVREEWFRRLRAVMDDIWGQPKVI